MLNAIGDSLSNLASSNYKENEEDLDDDLEDTAWGNLSEDDKPIRVMSTFSKAVRYHMRRFRLKQIMLEELTQQRWRNAADYICERDKKYRTPELKIPAVIKPRKDKHSAAPTLTTFGELIETIHIDSGIMQMPQGCSRPGSSHLRLGSVKPQSHKHIASHHPNTWPDVWPLKKTKPAENISFFPGILPSYLIIT